MATDLTDMDMSETYGGLLHAQGEPLPPIGRTTLYDGLGNRTALSVGRVDSGAKITGVTECETLSSGIIYSNQGDFHTLESDFIVCGNTQLGIDAINAPRAWVRFKGRQLEPIAYNNITYNQKISYFNVNSILRIETGVFKVFLNTDVILNDKYTPVVTIIDDGASMFTAATVSNIDEEYFTIKTFAMTLTGTDRAYAYNPLEISAIVYGGKLT